jgi:1,4-dihydroxy-2-naphthoyl-CoA hydrolase
MEMPLPFRFPTGLDGTLGLVVTEVSDGLMRGELPVADVVRQPFGLVHGGVYCAIAESLASIGTQLAVADDGKRAVGLSNHTSFLRPMTEGTIHGVARARHRGRTTWLWEVDLLDDAERLCATSRVTIAVRDAPADPV